MALSIVFQTGELVLPYYQDAIPTGTFMALSVVSAVGGLIARFIAQRNVSNE